MDILDDIRPDIIESGDPYHVAWTALRAGEQTHASVFGFYHSHFPEAYLRTALKYGGAYLRDAVLSFAEDYIVKLYSRFTATLVPSEPPARSPPRLGASPTPSPSTSASTPAPSSPSPRADNPAPAA